MERTLIIVKPDGVQRGLVGAILERFERRGLKLVGLKLMRIDRSLAEQHYAEHVGKGFYEGLVAYITAGPVVVGVLEGPDAIEAVRATVGATNPVKAAAGTIRGDFGLAVGRNLVHASDSPASARREVALFFREEELLSYTRSSDPWLLEQAIPPVW
ncbi:MAG: nucleoside-diphosphate kinase [Chloroflexi bacterium]|nr:nucleoside-diphosphate kinase [Chloroflexota bacterium]